MNTEQFIERIKSFELVEETDRGMIFFNNKTPRSNHYIAVAKNGDTKNGTKAEVRKWLRGWDQSCDVRREYYGSLTEYMNDK